MKYVVSLGYCGPTDCCLMINEKEYLIESFSWEAISPFWDIGLGKMNQLGHSESGQKILSLVYQYGDVDLSNRS